LREVRYDTFLGCRILHDVNGVPEAAEISTSGSVPIKGVGSKGAILAQEVADDFANENGTRGVDDL
jgi:hypothetical protein